MLNVHRIITRTAVEGPGQRFAIWLQGCNRHCEGCFVPQTWSKEPNLLYTQEQIINMINAEKDIEGITILGGEPFEQSEELCSLLMHLDKKLSVIIFTGYTLNELQEKNDIYVNSIIDMVDVLVDGEFIISQMDMSKPMIGSSNQKFHFFTPKYTINDFQKNKIEIRFQKNGAFLINGNGEIKKIKIN